jgi:hypothetical protein
LETYALDEMTYLAPQIRKEIKMELIIKGTQEEIKNVLQTINDSKGYMQETNMIFYSKNPDKVIPKMKEGDTLYSKGLVFTKKNGHAFEVN